MPMGDTDEMYGTNADGSKNTDYCKYCFENGNLTQNCTMEQMIEICVPHMLDSADKGMDKEDAQNLTEEKAREMMREFFPTLKRWKKQGMIFTFKLKEGVSEKDFLVASDEIQKNYLSKCKGFICRQLMMIDSAWTDWVIWETMADADNAMKQSDANESAKKFTSMIGEVVEEGLYPLERSY